jgi:hypothetical protein
MCVFRILQFESEATMTHAERRIVEFLLTSNATELVDLPDWFLALVEGDGGQEPSHEMITAASLMLVRRERPGIKFGPARRVLAAYASDPAKLEELATKIQAFRLSCGLERLKRAGLYEEILLGDPFDPDGQVSVRLSEEDWRFFNLNPTSREVQARIQRRHCQMN